MHHLHYVSEINFRKFDEIARHNRDIITEVQYRENRFVLFEMKTIAKQKRRQIK